MNRVTQYTILTETNADQLTSSVNQNIQLGWVPSGPITVYADKLSQAMIMFEN